jgi:hypothetical protein
MRVQISTTATQNVKSNTKRLCFLNLEDIKFQMSVLKLGIDYHQKMLYNARSNKVYNFHNRKYDMYRSVHGALQMTDVFQREQTRELMEREILKSM